MSTAPPTRIGIEDIRGYFEYLATERSLSGASCRLFRPREWLFPGRTLAEALSETSVQKAFTQAKARAGVAKIGGIHGLRHAYATHQLEAGLPVHRLLGHQDIHSTLRYIHWVPDYREGCGVYDLIAALGVGHG